VSEAILGVDLGAARIGIAICEGSGLPAVPLTTIAHTSWKDDIAAIVRLAGQRGVRRIVVGNPIRMDGSAGPAVEKVGAFVRELQAGFDGSVVVWDERFTTAIAAKKLRDLDLSGSKRRRHVDEMAAVEILSAYLARQSAS